MKKGKKMPSIEVEGRSEAEFVLVDGKIIRAERPTDMGRPSMPDAEFDRFRRD